MSTLISDRMKAKGFKSDAELASAVKCDRSMISRLRRGKAKPSLRLTVKLIEALGLPADAFLPDEEHAQ